MNAPIQHYGEIVITNDGTTHSTINNTINFNNHPEIKVIDHVQNTLDSEFLQTFCRNQYYEYNYFIIIIDYKSV